MRDERPPSSSLIMRKGRKGKKKEGLWAASFTSQWEISLTSLQVTPSCGVTKGNQLVAFPRHGKLLHVAHPHVGSCTTMLDELDVSHRAPTKTLRCGEGGYVGLHSLKCGLVC